MVLVDSSIWISFFSKGKSLQLVDLLKEDLVVTNELILTELIPFMRRAKPFDAIRALQAVQRSDLTISWDEIIELQTVNLNHGINKLGIPNLIIAQNAIQHNSVLRINDKHFRLMAEHINLHLYV